MKRPIIGITMDNRAGENNYDSPCTYAAAVEAAGGLPVLLPYQTSHALLPAYVDLLGGVLFTGGDDLDPALYGQSWHLMARPIDPARQNFELALLAEVEKRRTPALGICLGSQLMNVYRGGSLIQFLPDFDRRDAIEHRKIKDELPRHPAKVDLSSQLGGAIGKGEISVNSYHKQAAERLGRGLRVVAVAPDGIIEGFEDPTFPLFAAVQWHPERLYAEAEHLAPFKLLVKAARENNR